MTDSTDGKSGMTACDIFNGAFRQPSPQPAVIDLGSQPAQAGKFTITGVSRIRPSFLSTLLQPTFSATTVKQL
ncbi:hypothetical protein GGF41_008484, partial [Coemansia sp. RSA 2531]